MKIDSVFSRVADGQAVITLVAPSHVSREGLADISDHTPTVLLPPPLQIRQNDGGGGQDWRGCHLLQSDAQSDACSDPDSDKYGF